MTDEQFAAGVEIILARHPKGHSAHRALDLLWTRYTQELPADSPVRIATAKWMAMIEGDHADDKPYPLPRPRWFQRSLGCKSGFHDWVELDSVWLGVSARDCQKCGAHQGSGNPCP